MYHFSRWIYTFRWSFTINTFGYSLRHLVGIVCQAHLSVKTTPWNSTSLTQPPLEASSMMQWSCKSTRCSLLPANAFSSNKSQKTAQVCPIVVQDLVNRSSIFFEFSTGYRRRPCAVSLSDSTRSTPSRTAAVPRRVQSHI